MISEHQLQAQLVTFLKLQAKPGILWGAIGNGGRRSIGVAKKMKAEGVRPGMPDLLFILPEGRSAFLEMKIKGGKLSTEQKAVRDQMRVLGHDWAVAKTFDEACDFLRQVGVLKITNEAKQAKEKAR